MILPVHSLIRSRLQATLTETFGLASADQPTIVIETPPRRALGDLAVPVAFELARRLRKAPKVIACPSHAPPICVAAVEKYAPAQSCQLPNAASPATVGSK